MRDLPAFVEGGGHQIGEGGALDVASLLERVQIGLELHPRVAAQNKELFRFGCTKMAGVAT